MSQMPQWPNALANLGKAVFAASEDGKLPPLTIALCLPRLDFAALFIGVGIISKYLAFAQSQSEENRIKDLIGRSVILELENGKKIGGRLEYCEDSHKYKVCEYVKTKKKKFNLGESVSIKHVLNEKHWNGVRSADLEFNSERSVSRAQIDRSCSRTSSLALLGPIFDIPPNASANEAKCLFSAVGNKSRMHDELEQDLLKESASSLRAILRPLSLSEYDSSFRCRLESRDFRVLDDSGIMIAEASRCLGDLLHYSKNKHRVVLLGRNSADYQECSNLVRDAFERRKNLILNVGINLPKAFRSLAFHHS
jgi:hypothetical protein